MGEKEAEGERKGGRNGVTESRKKRHRQKREKKREEREIQRMEIKTDKVEGENGCRK